jgi:hypothetical protein
MIVSSIRTIDPLLDKAIFLGLFVSLYCKEILLVRSMYQCSIAEAVAPRKLKNICSPAASIQLSFAQRLFRQFASPYRSNFELARRAKFVNR